VEDILRCVLVKLHVPDQSYTVRLVRSIFVVVVGHHQQLWVLGRKRRGRKRRGA
jgi:hypothetical protein